MAFVRLLTATVLLLTGVTSLAGPSRVVKFKPGLQVLQVTYPAPFSKDLKTLLLDPTQPNLVFTSTTTPDWLALTSDGMLTGTPPAQPGSTDFAVSVKQTTTEEADLNHPFRITIIVNAAWDANPLNLGTAKEGVPYSFDLKPHVSDPAGSAFTFSASGLPGWLSLNAQRAGWPEGTLAEAFLRLQTG